VRPIVLLLSAVAVWAQGSEPKPRPEEYETHGRAGSFGIGAEFMVHSYSGEGQTYIAEDYLTVEVAVYPPKGVSLRIGPADFALRVNGKGPPLAAQSGLAAAAGLTNPQWRTSGPRIEGGVGVGDGGVVFGGPPGLGRPAPPSPRAPEPEDRSGLARKEALSAPDLMVRVGLPNGSFDGPVSGFLYFFRKGKIKSITSLELLYEGTVLKLR
jgi:hypothetical protein